MNESMKLRESERSRSDDGYIWGFEGDDELSGFHPHDIDGRRDTVGGTQ